MEKIVVITGTTATGKTELSLKLAEKVNGEIISADSMMVYRYMDIGTAKPTTEERKKVKHYLIDVVNPDENFSAKDFMEHADRAIKKILEKGKVPIIVGGTWLYIQTLLYGLSEAPSGNWKLREELYQKDSKELFKKLKEIDPEYAEKIHENDKKRIVRALEVYILTGTPFSTFQKKHSFKNKRYDFIGFNLERERSEIMDRIEKRVFKMIEEGLIEETKKLLDKGYEESITAKQAIGYKELIPYIKKEKQLDEAIQDIIKNTKDFAKRQIRTFRKKKEFTPVNLTEKSIEEATEEIIKKLNKEVLL